MFNCVDTWYINNSAGSAASVAQEPVRIGGALEEILGAACGNQTSSQNENSR